MDWSKRSRLPFAIRAALQALQFRSGADSLKDLGELEWERLLAWCDRMQLTLVLAELARPVLPETVRLRTDRDLGNNRERLRRQASALLEADAALRSAGVDYVLLKSFTHGLGYTAQPWLRQQCDLDLYSPHDRQTALTDVLTSLGYEPAARFEKFPMDHRPPMMRATQHRWSGDFFDPKLLIVFEPHFQFWDEQTERLPAPGIEGFWERRDEISLDGQTVPALDPSDRITYASLHALRHLLRGDLKVFHLYEIARFLHLRADDDSFWQQWDDRQSPETARYAAVVFELGRLWFDGNIPGRVAARIDALPESVKRWHERYAASPIEARFRPNKHELWLHFALLPPGVSGWSIAARKVAPRTLPIPPEDILGPASAEGDADRARARDLYFKGLAARAYHHFRALPELIGGLGMRAVGLPDFGAPFLTYLFAAALYHLGVFVFVLLYNLHIAELGFDERFIGLLTTAMTAGSLAGTLPGGRIAQRFGLRATLALCCGATPAIAALRSIVSFEAGLLALAFVAGLLFSIWVVCIAPTVAQLVPERRRAQAFSIFFAVSIATGVLGGALGGILPDWLTRAAAGVSLSPKQAALLAGCAITAAALVPVGRIRGLASAAMKRERYPGGRFIRRFIPAVFLWSLAVGAFNPFFNVYFARYLDLSTLQIGQLFSAGQLMQVGALLVAPVLLARLGRVSGIAAAQAAAGLTLLLLAFKQPLWLPSAAYLLYMSFQWMSEPGLHSLLMSRVDDGERTAASSLNYTAMFSAHAIAAAIAGWAIARWDYAPVLWAAGSLALLAAGLFRLSLAQFEREGPEDASRS
jgi:MFS family permease